MRRLIWLIAWLGLGLLQASLVAGESPLKRIPLSNGGGFWYERDDRSQITVLNLAFRGGKRAGAERPGLAWLTLKSGLELQNSSALTTLMELGVELNSQVHGDYSLVSIRVLSPHFKKACEILLKTLADPLFNSIRLDAIGQTMNHLREYTLDTPPLRAQLVHLGAFFPDSPYPHCEYGEEQPTEKIRVSDLKALYARVYNQENMVIAVNSDLEADQLAAILGPLCAAFPKGEPWSAPNLEPRPPPREETVLAKDKVQVLISSAWLLPAKSETEWAWALMLKTLLSDGIGSRFWKLRSELNLIYSTSAELSFLQGRVLLVINMRCEEGKRRRLQEALDRVLGELATQGIDSAEFQALQRYVQTQFFRAHETKVDRSFWVLQQALLREEAPFLSEFTRLSEAIKEAEFNDYIKAQLAPDRRSRLLIGPLAETAPPDH